MRRGSRLVAVGGHYGFEPTAYAATAGVANAALANLVRQMSWAYGELGVTSHLVAPRSEEHTSELQSLMRISYAVFCLNKKKTKNNSHIRLNLRRRTTENK